MGRRRDYEYDDDSDLEDRPLRRSSKRDRRNRSLTTTIVVVGVSLVILLAACGGFAWYAVTSMKKSMDAMAGQFGASEEAEEFLAKLSGDRVQTAYDSTSPAFKTSMTLDQFQMLVAKHPLLTWHTDNRPLTSKEPTGKTPNRRHSISYELTDPDFGDDVFDQPRPKQNKPRNGPKSLTVTLTLAEQPGGFWKVDGITVP